MKMLQTILYTIVPLSLYFIYIAVTGKPVVDSIFNFAIWCGIIYLSLQVGKKLSEKFVANKESEKEKKE